MTKKQVGKICTEARKAKGWTINRTATESGLKAHQIEGIEDGSKAYTFDSLLALAKALGYELVLQAKGSEAAFTKGATDSKDARG